MIVVDTNVLSELTKPVPSPNVLAWYDEQSIQDLFTTSITQAEIQVGVDRLPKGRRRVAERCRLGRPIEIMDAQIAAIALSHRAVIATRDAADFAHCGVRIVNPWSSRVTR
jgi:toxin FitB